MPNLTISPIVTTKDSALNIEYNGKDIYEHATPQYCLVYKKVMYWFHFSKACNRKLRLSFYRELKLAEIAVMTLTKPLMLC